MLGTELKNVQLSQLNTKQLDELAALVNERGVVFFRDQDLTTEKQVKLFEHFGILDTHPTQKVPGQPLLGIKNLTLLTLRRTQNILLSEETMQIGGLS